MIWTPQPRRIWTPPKRVQRGFFAFPGGGLGSGRPGGGGGGAFDYAGFLSGKTGDAWLADATHYTDTGRTTVASVNDQVASLTGAGAQFNFAQATSGVRPILRETSSKRYLEFDGARDMTAGANSNWNYLHDGTGNAYIAVAIQVGNSSNPDQIYAIGATYNFGTGNVGFAFAYEDRVAAGVNNAFRVQIARGSLGSPALENVGQNNVFPAQTDTILEIVKTGTSFQQLVNGTSVFTGTLSSPTSVNSRVALHLGSANTSFRLVGRVYAMMVCNAVPDSTQRAAIRADMSARCITPPI